jgi:hypothetical protein
MREWLTQREFFAGGGSAELVKTREAAVQLGQDMLKAGIIAHVREARGRPVGRRSPARVSNLPSGRVQVTNDHDFKESFFFYRFTVDNLKASDEYEAFINSTKGGSFMGHIDNGLRLVMPSVARAFRRLSVRFPRPAAAATARGAGPC